MKRLSKDFFLGSYISTTILLSILTLLMYVGNSRYMDYRGLVNAFTYTDAVELPWWLTLSSTLSSLIYIYFIVVLCIFIYNSWVSIQDGHARTSACKALGFLFIPFFNLYWVFRAIWGFAVDFNKYIARNNVNAAPRLPEGLFLALCIVYLLSFIPGYTYAIFGFTPYAYVSWAVTTASYVIGAVLINKVCDAVNALPPNKKLNIGMLQ
jgi:hypothetical protein